MLSCDIRVVSYSVSTVECILTLPTPQACDCETNRHADALTAIARTWSKQIFQVMCFVNYCSKMNFKLNLQHEIVDEFFLHIHWSGRRCGMPLKWNDIAVLSMRLTRHDVVWYTRRVLFCIDGRVYTNLNAWERLTRDCLVWQITYVPMCRVYVGAYGSLISIAITRQLISWNLFEVYEPVGVED